MQNAGAFLGIYAFALVTHRIGRKPAFAISFVLAAAATAMTFWFLDSFWQIFVLIPIMGFCQLALFGGYAIYFPELFPTRLAEHRHLVLLQRGPAGRGRRTVGQGPADQPGFRRLSRADALRRTHDVLGVPGGPARPPLRTRDQGQAAAGMNPVTAERACGGGGVSFILRISASRTGLFVELDVRPDEKAPWPRNRRVPSTSLHGLRLWRVEVPEAWRLLAVC